MAESKPYWMYYSRWGCSRNNGFWEVGSSERPDEPPIRRYPITRYDRAIAFALKLNHEEWESAMKGLARRQRSGRKRSGVKPVRAKR